MKDRRAAGIDPKRTTRAQCADPRRLIQAVELTHFSLPAADAPVPGPPAAPPRVVIGTPVIGTPVIATPPPRTIRVPAAPAIPPNVLDVGREDGLRQGRR